ARARADETARGPRQRRPRRDRRRRGALSRAPGAAHRRRGARRLVSLSEGAGTDLSGAPALPRALQRVDDAARLGLDRGHAGGARDAQRREHRAPRSRGAAAEPDSLIERPVPRAALPFFYGWVLVAAAFVTMAIGVNARTAFSLLFPPILAEFGWE